MQRPDVEYSLAAALVPPPGFSCVGAAFSTYSLDLEAFLAVLIALNGTRTIENEATIVQVQRSIMRLAKNVVVLCQRSRITVPKTNRRARVLTALDRCVDQKPYDERQRSWHAKCGLVAYKAADDNVASYWRLWIGSRNLTRSTDRDMGILLEGRLAEASAVQQMPGLGVALSELFGPVPPGLPSGFFPRTSGRRQRQHDTPWSAFEQTIAWSMPAGLTVQSVGISSNAGVWRALFVPPADRAPPVRLTLVAPFVDSAGLSHLDAWRGPSSSKSQVLSIAEQLHGLTPEVASRFELQAFRVEPEFIVQPGWPLADQEVQESTSTEHISVERAYRGLHAKMLIAEYKRGEALVILGSPNLTRRGLQNVNMELALRLAVKKEAAAAFVEQLDAWVEPLGDPSASTDEDLAKSELDRKIEDARKAFIGGFNAELHIRGSDLVLRSAAPLWVPPGFAIALALQTRPHDKTQARPGEREFVLLTDPGQQDETEFVLIELTHRASGEAVAWVQVVPFPALTAARRDERDHCLAADLMSLADLELLIASELGVRAGAESDHPWHRAAAPGMPKVDVLDTGFSLESLLRHRMRHPDLWRGPWVQQVQSLLQAFMASPKIGAEQKERLKERYEVWSVMVAAVEKWGST